MEFRFICVHTYLCTKISRMGVRMYGKNRKNSHYKEHHVKGVYMESSLFQLSVTLAGSDITA